MRTWSQGYGACRDTFTTLGLGQFVTVWQQPASQQLLSPLSALSTGLYTLGGVLGGAAVQPLPAAQTQSFTALGLSGLVAQVR